MLNKLKEATNFKLTDNGALSHKSTLSACFDMFAFGAAYRKRSDNDCILLFKNALQENEEMAMKLLFYVGDIRGGQGERRFFRVCYNWLAKNRTEVARRNMKFIPEYKRWDDLYCLIETPLMGEMLDCLKEQFVLDLTCDTPSLLGKWLPSQNTSSKETRVLAAITRQHFKLTAKEYRQSLSSLRGKINVLEKLMSSNQWDKIEFDKIPSKAGLIYRNAFARRDLIAQKYEKFAKSTETKVNADTLYPYELVGRAIEMHYNSSIDDATETAILNKYWENLPNYFGDKEFNGIAVVDTSGSMYGDPINVAISLGIYMAERSGGPFANHYISFSSEPSLVAVEGADFVDKVTRIYKNNIVSNTNIRATFDLILNTAIKDQLEQKDLPQNIVVISDMQFDAAKAEYTNTDTLLEGISKKFLSHGYKMPAMIFWNVNATSNDIPMIDPEAHISYVSGFSPSIFKIVISGKSGYDLMLETIEQERYEQIK